MLYINGKSLHERGECYFNNKSLSTVYFNGVKVWEKFSGYYLFLENAGNIASFTGAGKYDKGAKAKITLTVDSKLYKSRDGSYFYANATTASTPNAKRWRYTYQYSTNNRNWTTIVSNSGANTISFNFTLTADTTIYLRAVQVSTQQYKYHDRYDAVYSTGSNSGSQVAYDVPKKDYKSGSAGSVIIFSNSTAADTMEITSTDASATAYHGGWTYIGSGNGFYITNGHARPITWEKSSRKAKTVYKYLDGEEVVVNDGNTFIQIQPINNETKIS